MVNQVIRCGVHHQVNIAGTKVHRVKQRFTKDIHCTVHRCGVYALVARLYHPCASRSVPSPIGDNSVDGSSDMWSYESTDSWHVLKIRRQNNSYRRDGGQSRLTRGCYTNYSPLRLRYTEKIRFPIQNNEYDHILCEVINETGCRYETFINTHYILLY